MTMKRIAVLTSGGDAPGMNPAIRAVARMGISLGMQVFGVAEGYQGLLDGKFRALNLRDVGGIIGRGGTILQSARCEEFKTDDGRDRAAKNLRAQKIDGLITIGGNGTHKGAYAFTARTGFPVVTIASTIDNDVCYTDVTIGVDTALNTALDAIDKIRDTASSHRRAFMIETMGRNSGYLALMSGIAGGAEIILIPEAPLPPAEVKEAIDAAYARGKNHCLVICAEGYRPGIQAVHDYLKPREKEMGFTVRMTILGHIQRGGAPTAFDRVLATRLGVAAAQQCAEGNFGVMCGLAGNKVQTTDLARVVACRKTIDLRFYEMFKKIELASPDLARTLAADSPMRSSPVEESEMNPTP